MLKLFKWILSNYNNIKDWRIAMFYAITICFISYCIFFGGTKAVMNVIFGEDIKYESVSALPEVTGIDTTKVDTIIVK